MSIYLFANCWNELRLLPYFMRHYDPFVERFFVLDDGSTDGSVAFLRGQPKVTLIEANRKGGSYIEQTQAFFNEAWKESRFKADWVITCNIDEHLYHRNIKDLLRRCQRDGVTILPAIGHEMVALQFPSTTGRLCDEVRFGAPAQKLTGPSSSQNKIMVFNPLLIEEINFSPGRHQARPSGKVVYPARVELKLLHYKFLGCDYVVQRYAELKTGLSQLDLKSGGGYQYLWEARAIRRHHAIVASRAFVVVKAGWRKDMQLYLSFLPFKLASPFFYVTQFLSRCRRTRLWKRILPLRQTTP